MIRFTVIVVAVIVLFGCSNALYYYDKENLALNIEGRPDPSAPVQVSLGFKQRTVVVAPPIRSDGAGNGDTDAISMIGSFHAGNVSTFGKTTITAAFLSGEAAKFENEADAQAAAEALVPTPIPTADDNIRRKIQKAQDANVCAALRTILVRPYTPFSQLNEADKATMRKIGYRSDKFYTEENFKLLKAHIQECR